MINIFYSWQSDLPNNTNRSFIKHSIEKAISELNNHPIYEPERGLFELDHDTKNTPGSPAIDETIFQKIQNSDIFIADVSLAYSVCDLTPSPLPISPPGFRQRLSALFFPINNRTENRALPSKFAPNPNVMLELGFAAKCLSWDQIICLCNIHYGQQLPFDLSKRRILFYECSPNEDNKGEKRKMLSKSLHTAIREIEKHLPVQGRSDVSAEPASFQKLDDFYIETSKLIDYGQEAFKEVSLGPSDQAQVMFNVSEIEKISQTFKVDFKLTQENFLFIDNSSSEKQTPANGLIVTNKTDQSQSSFWKFQKDGFIYESRAFSRNTASPKLWPIEWLLMDICQPLLFLNNLFQESEQFKVDTEFKAIFKWFQTNGKILTFGNMAEFDRYQSIQACQEQNIEAEVVFAKDDDIQTLVYSLLDSIFHQCGRGSILEESKQLIDRLLNQILVQHEYPKFG